MSVDAWQWAALAVLTVVLLGLTALLVALLRSYADLVRTLHDLGIKLDPDAAAVDSPIPVGSAGAQPGGPASDVAGTTLEGMTRALSMSGGTGPLLLAFLSSGCGTCVGFWREIRQEPVGRIGGIEAPVVVVTKSARREEPGRLEELTGGAFDIVMSDETWAAYDVPVTPHFVLVDRRSGTILGEGSAPDPAGLADLLARAVADSRAVSRRDLLQGTFGAES